MLLRLSVSQKVHGWGGGALTPSNLGNVGRDNNCPRAQSMGKKGKNKTGDCQDLRCLIKATSISQEGPTRFQDVLPQS